ncbi:MAG: acylphosphatase [Actinomycetota bacterium]
MVAGRVQGVFFRDSCRRAAESEGVSGSARNLPDGRVEVILEGAPDPVERMVEWCRRGPSHAVVESVEVETQAPEGLTGFTTT